MKLFRNHLLLIILSLASVISIFPFLHSGFFNIHDATQVQRVFEMRVALLDGMFPVRWVPDLGYGYGYPIFNFYGPLPYYIGAGLTFLGFDSLGATKIMIALGVVGAAFTMYFLAKEFWGKTGAIFSAMLYLFAPYHALNVYVRGAIGEVFAYLFIPLVFYGLWKYYKSSSLTYLMIGGLSFAAVIISHNLSAMMIAPFVLIVTTALMIKERRFHFLLVPLLGIVLSAFYWIPALAEMRYTDVASTIGGKADFKDHFVCLRQTWDSPWMFGGSIPGCVDGLSFRIGKLHVVFALFALPLLFLLRKAKEKSSALIFALGSLLLSFFLLLSVSVRIWEVVPYMDFFQYPWRFLLVVSLFSSFAGGALIYYLLNLFKANRWVSLFVLLFVFLSPIILYSKLFYPQQFLEQSSEEYTNKDNLNWTTSKISDEYMPEGFLTPASEEEIVHERISGKDIKVTYLVSTADELFASILVSKPSDVLIRIPYFPAWIYYLNGEMVAPIKTNTGMMMRLPAGESEVKAKFEQTSIEKLSNLITLCGVLSLFTVIIYAKQKRKKI